MTSMEMDIKNMLKQGATYSSIREIVDKIEEEDRRAEDALRKAKVGTARVKLVEAASDYVMAMGVEVTPEDLAKLEQELVRMEELIKNSADFIKGFTTRPSVRKVIVKPVDSSDSKGNADEEVIQDFLDQIFGKRD
jgi:Mg2+ and Co2+ transporter CorA